ncbi:MerR family transcriptional regulator [Actinoplanes sp. TBRC 11911]|uniref:MerR family transcriptional regulator n=1 Tax=Actinoplanes sp. TBRC 11911 TaxID=2729386 RepID=UPI00145DBE57|nr:MerR family transcriptional regulator [Actinoplanes sp. TBRC 11911]NMO51543.1 MerR family transcriptional regulator [Actinoplanes sp. TBRC 11911]
MDELVEKVREALAAEYPGAPNGRVRDVPDRRAIRWYTTIGLVDKPLGMRGRTALYGPRHLQQLVAIKRLQAEGRSLAQIQADFTWLSPEGLGEVSQVPQALMADTGALGPELSGRHARFWADAPAPGVTAVSPAGARAVTAVPLDGGVILLVPQTLNDRDRADVTAAAAPLIALLAARGLTDGSSS